MRFAQWMAIGALMGAGMGTASAGEGLWVPQDHTPWPRWQGRVAIDANTPLWRSELLRYPAAGLKAQGLGVVGDYYFASAPLGSRGAGGFRATSGILLGSARTSLGALPVNGSGSALTLGRRNVTLASGLSENEAGAWSHQLVPYLGLGYSGLTGRSGWGFAADLGVMGVAPNAGVRLGRAAPGAPTVDDLLRDLRFAPVIQFGVSYSF